MEWCQQYKVSGNVRDLNQAWDLYYHVFRRITRQLPQLTSLELNYVSPKLLVCRDLELAVPGSYVPNQTIVRIAYIQSSLQVITSKQRPRKLCIKGYYCVPYKYYYAIRFFAPPVKTNNKWSDVEKWLGFKESVKARGSLAVVLMLQRERRMCWRLLVLFTLMEMPYLWDSNTMLWFLYLNILWCFVLRK